MTRGERSRFCRTPTSSSTPGSATSISDARIWQTEGAETRADSEFDDCLKRRGEALSLFIDEEPTYGYLPVVYYYQGLGREKIGTTGYRDSYKQYLAIRGNSTEDRLVQDVRKRVGN